MTTGGIREIGGFMIFESLWSLWLNIPKKRKKAGKMIVEHYNGEN